MIDFSHPEGASMMFDGKKAINRKVFASMRNPTAPPERYCYVSW
jgi:hypothetical protein